ncbi:aspartate aminotransferase family protein, partial [Pseudomonas aeruginosa]
WQELADHPVVGDARGVGLVAALELVKNMKPRESFTDKGVGMMCREHCFRNCLFMRAVGDPMIISPPLVVDPSHIDELIILARNVLDQTASAVLA